MRGRPVEGGARAALGAWALTDQGVVSLGTFLTNVILARTLTPYEYGVYGVYLAVFHSLNTVHSSVVTYPLSTSGAAPSCQSLRREASGALLLTAGLWMPLLLVVAGAGAAMGNLGTMLAAAAAVACWQAQETTRRAMMAALRHRQALWGDALSYLGQAVVVWLLVRARSATIENIFAAMAVTSLAAALVQGFQFRPARISRPEFRRMGQAAWRLGRWTLPANLTGILSGQMFVWAVAGFRGPSEAGALLAVFNVLGVSHPFLFSLGNLIIPAASGAFRSGGAERAWRTAWRYGRQGLTLAAPCLAVLLVAPELVLGLLYGPHSRYAELAVALRLGAAAYLLLFASQVFGCYLGAVREVKRGLLVQISGAGASVLAGLPLAVGFGASGACGGLCLVNLTRLLAGAACSHSVRRQAGPQGRDLLRVRAASAGGGG